jgi:predicted DCC family thiol-disulfide oxidoreductase YuxK
MGDERLLAAAARNELDGPAIVYDGDCPFCSRYVKLLKLRDTIGPVELIDARDANPVVQTINAAGIDLDSGFVFIFAGRCYHAEEAIHRLALLTTPVGLFNRTTVAVFRSPVASKIFYPVLLFGRNMVLRLKSRDKLNSRSDAGVS